MFPDFNIHSTPLLILVIQGVLFAVLLLWRYTRTGNSADLIVGVLLLIIAYDQITYTVGFMGWYTTFKNTKINYYLIPVGLIMGPLIYLYVRSLTIAPFKLRTQDWWHVLPFGLLFVWRVILLAHDSMQPGWDEGYSGEWKANIHEVYVDPFLAFLSYISKVIYLSFAIQLFIQYNSRIRQYFSNLYRIELRWLRNFLVLYVLLFTYGLGVDIVDSYITNLDYIHRWWTQLFFSIAIVYVGIKAYFTDMDGLYTLTMDVPTQAVRPVQNVRTSYDRQVKRLEDYMVSSEAYLNPEYSLKDLSSDTGLSTHDTSEAINNGIGVNFNEFINSYRVERVKTYLQDDSMSHLSLVAIALESGFNSKATFNRVFKRLTDQSPSEYRASLRPEAS